MPVRQTSDTAHFTRRIEFRVEGESDLDDGAALGGPARFTPTLLVVSLHRSEEHAPWRLSDVVVSGQRTHAVFGATGRRVWSGVVVRERPQEVPVWVRKAAQAALLAAEAGRRGATPPLS